MADLNPYIEIIQNLYTQVVRGFTSSMFLAVLTVFFIMLIYDILKQGWGKSLSGRFIKGSMTSLGIMALNAMLVPVVYFGVTYLEIAYDTLGIPHLPNEIWSSFPFWIAGLIGIFLFDFADYWNHRAMHHRWVWPIHAVHHSDEEVNALTTVRVHMLEVLFMKGTYILFLSWFGLPAEAATFGAVILVAHNAYTHANLDWDHGPLKLLIASPRFHRWHHANDKRAFGKNLANVVPLYDYIFGTYYMPDKCRSPMGADGVPHSDLVGLMFFPFKAWHAMIKRSLKKIKPSQNEVPQTEAK